MQPPEVRANNNSCIIRWKYKDKRYSLTWGKWSSEKDRSKLEIVGLGIYKECLADAFDETLVRYKDWLSGIAPVVGLPKAVKKQPALIQLLEERLQENYNNADDAALKLLHFYKQPIETVEQAKDFIKWIKNRGVTSSTVKRYLNTLKALRKDLFGEIKIKVEEKPKPAPFNAEEVNRILQAFETSEQYSSYFPFVVILLNTGCRISEAIGMRWQDLNFDKKEIHIYESLVRNKGNSSNRIRKTTKTSKYRVVPMNNRVFEVLNNLNKKGELVFYSPEGAVINDNNFAQRTWRTILNQQGIPYRSPYKTRATFASHCAESGIPAHVIAEILGHSKVDTTMNYYLGSIKRPDLPEL